MEEPGGTGTDKDNVSEVTTESLWCTRTLNIYNNPPILCWVLHKNECRAGVVALQIIFLKC